MWLHQHQDFEQRPASIPEFLGPKYLDLTETIRESVYDVLIDIFGEEVNSERIALVQEAIFTGAIGIGKTTLASIVIPYMAHWALCLRDPQHFYGLMPGTRIAFMLMSTSRLQAKNVVYSDIKARIDYSPWFNENYQYDPKITSLFKFPKDIWIIPGDSSEKTFEGFNILGGIVDEIDSHKVTLEKSYVEQGYDTIRGRVSSRFGDLGFILLIGQMKSSTGFAAKMYRRHAADPRAYAARMSIWDSYGWDRFTDLNGNRQSFWFDCDRMQMTTKTLAELQGYPDHIIEIPKIYQNDFVHSPYKSLRDLAGRPSAVASPLFNDPSKIQEARKNWLWRFNVPEGPVDHKNRIADWFKAGNSVKRVVHVDIAYSAQGDALGLAMGHVPEVVDVDGELKPFICIDLIMRFKAAPGTEIFLGDIRRIIYDLKDKRGFNIVTLTTDGFQSTDFRQQIERKRIHTDQVSTDKTTLPYFDLYDAVSEDRIAIPPYNVALSWEQPEPIDILFREISQLVEEGNKIEHPPEGSKDLADAVACVVSTLMGSKRYKRSAGNNAVLNTEGENRTPDRTAPAGLMGHHAVRQGSAMMPRAPMPPRGLAPSPWRTPR
jgi:hypothetical protein